MDRAPVAFFQCGRFNILKNIGKIQRLLFPGALPARRESWNSSFTISAKDLCAPLFAAIKRRGSRRIYCFLKA
jgi:hypothetical protein